MEKIDIIVDNFLNAATIQLAMEWISDYLKQKSKMVVLKLKIKVLHECGGNHFLSHKIDNFLCDIVGN